MFALGAIFGSFACCQAWRIHEKSNDGKKLGSRSVCMHCKKKLSWYDNIPIISWLVLRGRCRFCHEKIGKAEILSELGLAIIFLAITILYTFNFSQSSGPFADFISTPHESSFSTSYSRSIASKTFSSQKSANFADIFSPSSNQFGTFLFEIGSNPVKILLPTIILLIAMIPYWILLIYDAKWSELPVSIMIIDIVLALLYQLCLGGFSSWSNVLHVLLSAVILAGIYYLLYFFSKEKWVGGGDWILCVSIGIFLGNEIFAFIELFLANFIATFFSIPRLAKKDHSPIPFGPFLIIALVVIYLFAQNLNSLFLII